MLSREALAVETIPRLLLECEGAGEWWDLHLIRSLRDELERFSPACGSVEE